MNARKEAGHIARQLPPHRPVKWLITGEQKRRAKLLEWLRFYGVDASRFSGNFYVLTRVRFMGGPIKNPPSRSSLGKAAYKTAHLLYKHFKETGVPQSVIDRISPKIRHYVVYTLELNGVKIVKKNPPDGSLTQMLATRRKSKQTLRELKASMKDRRVLGYPVSQDTFKAYFELQELLKVLEKRIKMRKYA